MFVPKKILVPTDFSRRSDAALRHALDIAKQFEARLYLFHAIGIVHQCSVDYCLNEASLKAIEKETMKSAREMMAEQVRRVSRYGDAEISFDLKMGVPSDQILKEQQGRKADLIVMASRGNTGLLSHLGSVSDKVVRTAKCPVLIVKGNED